MTMLDDGKIQEQQSQETVGLGKRLCNARESKGLTTDDVATRLHLNRQIILDLEDDNYKYVSAETYAKGYLRAYARLLDLPVDEVLSAYDAMDCSKKIISDRPKISPQLHVAASAIPPRKIVMLVLAVLVSIMSLWWFLHSAHAVNVSSKIDADNADMSQVRSTNATPSQDVSVAGTHVQAEEIKTF